MNSLILFLNLALFAVGIWLFITNLKPKQDEDFEEQAHRIRKKWLGLITLLISILIAIYLYYSKVEIVTANLPSGCQACRAYGRLGFAPVNNFKLLQSYNQACQNCLQECQRDYLLAKKAGSGALKQVLENCRGIPATAEKAKRELQRATQKQLGKAAKTWEVGYKARGEKPIFDPFPQVPR